MLQGGSGIDVKLQVPARKMSGFRMSFNFMDSLLVFQGGICAVLAIALMTNPAGVRDLITDKTTSNCERLAGCGLTEYFLQLSSYCCMCCTYLAWSSARYKDFAAKSVVAKFFIGVYIANVVAVLADKHSTVHSLTVFNVLVPWMILMSASFGLAMFTSAPKKVPRSPMINDFT
mmetsp:Transcript_988/g.2493  ORF Transcript_988/g.2493 Transcript_988/m.2493 type:complete len:174 (+) Transcript_988:145-666(+)